MIMRIKVYGTRIPSTKILEYPDNCLKVISNNKTTIITPKQRATYIMVRNEMRSIEGFIVSKSGQEVFMPLA